MRKRLIETPDGYTEAPVTDQDVANSDAESDRKFDEQLEPAWKTDMPLKSQKQTEKK